jgi:RimJ/RimL family protein N-acetyltransferase
MLSTAMTSSTPHIRIPETTTTRLQLREFELRDARDIFILNSNPKMTEYQSWDPLKEEGQAIKFVERAMAGQLETPRTSLALVVASKADGTFLGNVGADIDYENSTTEIWYSIAPEFHGKGYATEAVEALISLLPINNKIEIECDLRNVASRKLADRLGFLQTNYKERAYECKGYWVDVVTYVKEQHNTQQLETT